MQNFKSLQTESFHSLKEITELFFNLYTAEFPFVLFLNRA